MKIVSSGRKTAVLVWAALAILGGVRVHGQTLGTSTDGDITAKGDLTVSGGDIRGSDGSPAITMDSSQVKIGKDVLSIPKSILMNDGNLNAYELKAEDYHYTDGYTKQTYVFPRLTIRAKDHSVQRSIAICDDGWSNDKGIVVRNQGSTGIGNVNELSMKPMTDLLYMGSTESIVIHEGGSKAMMFNAEIDPAGTHFNYLSNYNVRPSSPAGSVMMDYMRGLMQIWTAPPGVSGADIDLTATTCGLTINTLGYVGIRSKGIYQTPLAALDLNGGLLFRRCSGAPVVEGQAMIYADSTGTLQAVDASGDKSTFSPHDDPRSVDPLAQSSFGDPSVALPFSFKHENAYLGKGEIVDMAKLVKYIEEKMKAEKGETAGKLIYSYALPKEEIQSEADREVKMVLDELAQNPWIKVPVGEDGKIPPAALVEVDEVTAQTKTVEVPEKKVDFESGRIVTVMRKKDVQEKAPTGRKVKRFRNGWTFENGELFRRTTVEDLDLNAIQRRHPKLPDWVLQRMKMGQQTSQSVSALIEEIKKRLAQAEKPGAGLAMAESPEAVR